MDSSENKKTKESEIKGEIEFLIEALKDPNDSVVFTATEALERIRDKRAVKPLIEFLKDKYEFVREEVARELGGIRDKRALGPLKNALQIETNSYAKEAIRKAIQKIENK